MSDDKDQPVEDVINHVRIANLPYGVTAKEISAVFGPFGNIIKMFLKRRVSKESSVFLTNPFVILVFDKSECIDHIMASRPFYMGDCQLFIRRFMPFTKKYPHDAFLTVKKILIHTESEKTDEILPDDTSIVDYLTAAGGRIEYYARLDDKTVLVQFDDYDPVDLCCLARPHFIKNQPVEIEKCSNEEQVRRRVELQKSNSISTEISSTTATANIENHTMETVSPTPVLSVDDQITQLRSTYNDMTSRLEREHEQLVASLSAEWKETAKERIRFQRLILDYQQEHERIAKENRKWQKLFSDSLREKPVVQTEGEQKLKEACQKTATAKANYDQLIQNIQQ